MHVLSNALFPASLSPFRPPFVAWQPHAPNGVVQQEPPLLTSEAVSVSSSVCFEALPIQITKTIQAVLNPHIQSSRVSYMSFKGWVDVRRVHITWHVICILSTSSCSVCWLNILCQNHYNKRPKRIGLLEEHTHYCSYFSSLDLTCFTTLSLLFIRLPISRTLEGNSLSRCRLIASRWRRACFSRDEALCTINMHNWWWHVVKVMLSA